MRDAATVLEIIRETKHGNHDEHWRAGYHGNGYVRFGGGPSEKALLSRDLVGGLPDRRAAVQPQVIRSSALSMPPTARYAASQSVDQAGTRSCRCECVSVRSFTAALAGG
jgi:hypothetical protein